MEALDSLFNLINQRSGADKIYWYAKDPYEEKSQFLINKRESTGLRHFNDSKAFIEYSKDIDDNIKNIDKYNWNKKQKILIDFDMVGYIADMVSNIKLNLILIVTELFVRGRKLNISLVFITQSYFAVPKNIRLNSTHYFIMKIQDKQELQQIEFNHSSDIEFQDFVNIYKKRTAKPYSFLIADATIALDKPLRFRKNLLEKI